MKIAIVSNGEEASKRLLEKNLENIDYIICADGGVMNLLVHNIIPNLVVGDFDSLSEEHQHLLIKKGVKMKRFPKEKDQTDTELAADVAVELSPDEIVFLCSTGTRLDHTLANISLLIKLAKKGIAASIVNNHNRLYALLPGNHEMKSSPGTFISLLPLTPEVKRISTNGLKYQLTDYNLPLLSPLGVSNCPISENWGINFIEGILLLIISKD